MQFYLSILKVISCAIGVLAYVYIKKCFLYFFLKQFQSFGSHMKVFDPFLIDPFPPSSLGMAPVACTHTAEARNTGA